MWDGGKDCWDCIHFDPHTYNDMGSCRAPVPYFLERGPETGIITARDAKYAEVCKAYVKRESYIAKAFRSLLDADDK